MKTTLNPPPLALNSLLPPPLNKDRPLSDTKREDTVSDSHEGMRIKSKLASNLNSHSKAMKVQDDLDKNREDDEYGT